MSYSKQVLGVALALALTMVGCKTFPSDTKQIQVACASATSSIQIATLYKEKLTAAQVTGVKQAIAVTQPVCGDPDTIPTLDSVKRAALEAAVGKLFQIAMEVRK